jgi:hypothetical protein
MFRNLKIEQQNSQDTIIFRILFRRRPRRTRQKQKTPPAKPAGFEKAPAA